MDENKTQLETASNVKIKAELASKWRDLIRIAVTVFVTFVCCTIFFFIFLRFDAFAEGFENLWTAADSIIIGLMLAYLMNPIMIFIQKRVYRYTEHYCQTKKAAQKMAKGIAIAGTTIILLLLITALLALVLPALISSISHFVNEMPRYARTVQDYIENGRIGDTKIKELLGEYVEEAAKYLQKWFQDNILKEARNYISQITNGVISVVKGVMDFIIGIIVMDYVMAIQTTLLGQCKKMIYAVFKPKQGNMIIETIRKASSIFGGFITGKLIDSAIIAVIAYCGCSLLRIPDAILVSAIIGITNIIPFFGPFIGAVPSLVIVVLQSPWHALYLLIFIVVLQQVDGNIIGPKILGNSTGMSSFWIMVAILVGGGVFGVAGMIFGVPVLAVIGYIVTKTVDYVLKGKKLPTDVETYVDLKKVDITTNAVIRKTDSGSESGSK